MAFDTQKTEAIVLSRRRRTPLANARGIKLREIRCTSTSRRHGGWASGPELATDSKGAPRRDQEGQERAKQATESRGTGWPLTRELPTGLSSMCPSSSHLRVGTVVEGRRRPQHQTDRRMINRGARLTLGAFRTTNQGALSLESGLRPAPAQLDNRLRRFALRLAGDDQARELTGAPGSMLG